MKGDKLADAVAADVYHPGFLGPGSYAVLLPQDEEQGQLREREESVASERSDRELTHQHTISKSMRYQMAYDVLSTLRHYNAIRDLIIWYNASNEAGVVPAQIQVDAVNALEAIVDKHDLRRKAPSPELIDQVLDSTARPFVISQSLEARDFHILCSGENLRFEVIGLLLATAGRSLTFGLPFDIADDVLTGDNETLQTAIQALDSDKWNTQGQWLRASWIRLRYMSLRFREEILEFSLIKIDASAEAQLMDISQRIRTSWEALPKHLQYWKTCWEENVPSTICLMLCIVHLTHWYNEFMIQRLIDYSPLTLNTALLRVSIDLLSNTLTLGTVRDRLYDVHRDMLNGMLLFGIPAASVLATALREQHLTGQQFPAEVSRAEIIRMLSVLISHLDAAAHMENSGARHGEANYNLCRKGSKIFTKVIDAVLDSKPVEEVMPVSDSMGQNLGLDLFSGAGLDGFEGMDFPGLGMGLWNGNDMGTDLGTLGPWNA
ncbi:fungal specific transcription factor [Pyrenophora seminiperda CCB06]|uniref:Fungal specific transcription factor n=1 Tax=Pyrenophora seminiperda CCB06 TaxID=1302712 RepID=A0A3M7M9L1_9PLEO|nr:fungal specific transcription factor [Pyrenophora seminiperda CCB06]